MSKELKEYFLGVDVGTASVRACIVDENGKLCSTSTKEITIWNPRSDFYQQSSNNIWASVIHVIRKSVSDAGIERIGGIGFDATCSMVVLDEDFNPVSVSPNGESEQNIIMWMDHRAKEEVELINSTHHAVLESVGGIMSVEMQPPKLMWLKKNLPETWQKAKHFFDLPDFLTWKATGSLTRGLCSIVCKWSYRADTHCSMGWDESFFKLIGLEDLAEEKFARIGLSAQAAGTPCGSGLSQDAAQQLNLQPSIPVGTSLIDAHAGVLGCLGCCPSEVKELPNIDNRLVIIAGTSTCHIICSHQRVYVPGVWGPFMSAVVPGLWVNEGGQSSAGSLLDHITSSHPAFSDVNRKAAESGVHVFEYLNQEIDKLAIQQGTVAARLTKSLHVWPDFHGNRSPMADPNLCGMISGLRLSSDEASLAMLYLATVQALAYGTKHMVSEMEKHGHTISMVYMCGGLRSNQLYVQTHADVLGLPVALPDNKESVMLGAAMLGATASGKLGGLTNVMTAMGGGGTHVYPNLGVKTYYEKKYAVFLQMLTDQLKYRQLMQD